VITETASEGLNCFSLYSEWYNHFYQHKNYESESTHVLGRALNHRPNQMKHWLDLGCGTGRHAAHLATCSLQVVGVDASQPMISKAREAYPSIEFHVADIGDFRLQQEFDAASMLYHVINYLEKPRAVHKALLNVADHLKPGGLLLFDFWHTDGVRSSPPENTYREVVIGNQLIARIGYATEFPQHNLVVVDYEFRLDSIKGAIIHREQHRMLHFSETRLSHLLTKSGFALLECEGWMTGAPLTENDWYGFIVAEKITPERLAFSVTIYSNQQSSDLKVIAYSQ